MGIKSDSLVMYFPETDLIYRKRNCIIRLAGVQLCNKHALCTTAQIERLQNKM